MANKSADINIVRADLRGALLGSIFSEKSCDSCGRCHTKGSRMCSLSLKSLWLSPGTFSQCHIPYGLLLSNYYASHFLFLKPLQPTCQWSCEISLSWDVRVIKSAWRISGNCNVQIISNTFNVSNSIYHVENIHLIYTVYVSKIGPFNLSSLQPMVTYVLQQKQTQNTTV